VLDQSCLRVLKLIRTARNGMRQGVQADFPAHHALARRMAAESIVLLKNDDHALPLDASKARRIVVVGDGAREPIIQGSGCATTRPTQTDVPLDEIARQAPRAKIAFHPVSHFSGSEETIADALAEVDGADVVLFFANTKVGYDGEGSDRDHLNLDDGQDELIDRLSRRNNRTVVIVASPDAVVMPWIDQVPAVLAAFFAGQGAGAAIADVLFGKQNPCGKLTVTFPRKLSDTPAFLTYPGENDRHIYSEGIHVGYRYYDKRDLIPLFPFGFGLGYSRFDYSAISIDHERIDASSTVKVSFSLSNVGQFAGKEIVQLYARPHASRLIRPIRELKGFAKVALQPGETKRVEIEVEARDLRYYDPVHRAWLLDAGKLTFEVGASSRDIRLEKTVDVEAAKLPSTVFDVESQPFLVFEQPLARKRFGEFLMQQLDLDDQETGRLLDRVEGSFLGIHSTIAWYAGDKVSKSAMAALLADLNKELGAIAKDSA
jgi:beta-glucosidase